MASKSNMRNASRFKGKGVVVVPVLFLAFLVVLLFVLPTSATKKNIDNVPKFVG